MLKRYIHMIDLPQSLQLGYSSNHLKSIYHVRYERKVTLHENFCFFRSGQLLLMTKDIQITFKLNFLSQQVSLQKRG